MKNLIIIFTAVLSLSLHADSDNGKILFQTFCASCHGPKGAGLVGPNLTDKEILHGTEKKDIIKVINEGVPGKGMPPWESILDDSQKSDLADYVKSIMGLNLPSQVQIGISTVTPFPKGDLKRPYLMRTFMPRHGLGDEVFANHDRGKPTQKYSPRSGTFNTKRKDNPIEGIPGAIAVNFGPQLSYCFDSTECRLLYTWSGDFMDMTNYWGAGAGGSRKKFGYIGKILGKTAYKAKGKAPLTGKPQFKGYRKLLNVPEYMYSIGDIDFTLKIVPGKEAGTAVCHYTATGHTGELIMKFDPDSAAQMSCSKGDLNKDGILKLSESDASSFTITIKPNKE